MEETTSKKISDSEFEDTNPEYEDIIKRENELQKQMIKSKSNINECSQNVSKIPMITWISELKKGEIIDMEYNSESNLILEVKLDTNKTVEVTVEDSGDYSEDNKLSRLLVSKNINNGLISDLIGKNITLVSESYIGRRVCYEDIEWKVYIPLTLDIFGKIYFKIDTVLRSLSVPGFQEFIHQSNSFAILVMPPLLIAIFLNFYSLLFMILSFIFYGTVLTSEAIVAGLLLTILTSLMSKICSEINHKYTTYRKKDTLN